jgi:Glycosyl transferase family 2
MRSPGLFDLPAAPTGKNGWPWTEESSVLPNSDGQNWPRITVITPSFNHAPFLEETIRSVLLQGYPDLEYIILDGGSTDGSVDIIKKYCRWLTYWVSEPDAGQSNAINRGLKIGSGLFATWINSDDMVCKNALVNQASRCGFACNTVYVGICTYIDENGTALSSHQGNVHSLEELVSVASVWRSGGHIVQPEVLFPRDLALAVGGLDVNNHRTMDYELWGKFFLAGAEFRYTDVPFGMFRQHQTQKSYDILRQTRSILETAARLTPQAPSLSETRKSELLTSLRDYAEMYEQWYWKGSGRLARLGLPRPLVLALRRLRALLRKAVPELG